MNIKPIETKYKGYRFRSRLEARWAKYFDSLGIPWEYELDGYEIAPGKAYLPDFWFPAHDCFVEVKPTSLDQTQADKLFAFVVKYDVFLLLLIGTPDYTPYNLVFKLCNQMESENCGSNYDALQKGIDCPHTQICYKRKSENATPSPRSTCFCGIKSPINYGVEVREVGFLCVELAYGWNKDKRFWEIPCGDEAKIPIDWDNDPVGVARYARFEYKR